MEVDDVINDLYKLKAEVFSGKARNFTIGRHRSRIIGSGYRIKKISRWKRGDPFHLIDWQMTLRTWPGEIYKIETVETKEVPIFLVIDSSPSMLVRFKDEDSKFVLALKVMATLGFTGMYFNDPVGIASFGLAAEILMSRRHCWTARMIFTAKGPQRKPPVCPVSTSVWPRCWAESDGKLW